ncbi:hypothetical protein GCM10023314_08550 [Algibacter agarivorans]|uniref:Bacterial surface antigen (D15) domain-containing protein n=1 Tax=Algibacter agarivorans TaxID=1109741 RepID=A0ABP9GCP9_9FLAO
MIVLTNGIALYGQKKDIKSNSIGLYTKAEIYSKRNKFAKTIHNLIFKSTNLDYSKKDERLQDYYKDFHNKPIRHIFIETLDPFGYSVYDTNKRPKNLLGKIGNSVHIKSYGFVIKNLLLFKEKQALDTLLIYESKRLMRSQSFIRSVKIDVKDIGTANDSVDVTVRVLDSWSIIPKGSGSSSGFKLALNERNFLGFGHKFNNRYSKNLNNGNSSHSFEYFVPTIKNTYISTTIASQKTPDGFFNKHLNIERRFISPLTRWAGGLYFNDQFKQSLLPDNSQEFTNQTLKFKTQDIWIGHAFKILKEKSLYGRTTNLIASLRQVHVKYNEKPQKVFDSINYFSNEHFYLGRIGIASRQFVQGSYIFRDGIIEDLPIGFSSSITSGFQRKNQKGRSYIGCHFAMAKHLKWGYFNFNLGYGTFLRHMKTEQSAFTLELNYFTNLINLGNHWKMRQFIKPQLLFGFNRRNSIADRLSLNGNTPTYGYDLNNFRSNRRTGINGFEAELYGARKTLLSLKTQFYSPWNIIGFRLNPFIDITSGIIGQANNTALNNKVYSAFSLGFVVRNDYLVFSSFQLSLSYYPKIPGDGNNIFKINTFQTEDSGIQSIGIGKPSTVWYQ